MLQDQYDLVKASRKMLLHFLDSTVGPDLHKPIQGYEHKTIFDLAEHTANCYFDWIVSFAGVQQNEAKKTGPKTIAYLLELYKQVDELVIRFLDKYCSAIGPPINSSTIGTSISVSTIGTPISGKPDPNGPPVTASPLQVFTQMITHEFHHKGQIVYICRLFGHIPPETDAGVAFDGIKIA